MRASVRMYRRGFFRFYFDVTTCRFIAFIGEDDGAPFALTVDNSV